MPPFKDPYAGQSDEVKEEDVLLVYVEKLCDRSTLTDGDTVVVDFRASVLLEGLEMVHEGELGNDAIVDHSTQSVFKMTQTVPCWKSKLKKNSDYFKNLLDGEWSGQGFRETRLDFDSCSAREFCTFVRIIDALVPHRLIDEEKLAHRLCEKKPLHFGRSVSNIESLLNALDFLQVPDSVKEAAREYFQSIEDEHAQLQAVNTYDERTERIYSLVSTISIDDEATRLETELRVIRGKQRRKLMQKLFGKAKKSLLSIAFENKREDLCKILLRYGADPDIRQETGKRWKAFEGCIEQVVHRDGEITYEQLKERLLEYHENECNKA